MLRVGLVQLNAGDDPALNLPVTEGFIRDAAAGGAQLVVTPEVTNIVSMSRRQQWDVVQSEATDATLARLRAVARALGVWVVIGSLVVVAPDGQRFVNRSFLIGPDGEICARYDKIHMFDVDLPGGETYRESAGFQPGQRAVIAHTAIGVIGLSICYDMRFGALFRTLAQAGAQIITVPSAFTVPTGQAHWHVLLRARAIETGCYILAPAQCGHHAGRDGKSRDTYGHSLVVAPWGQIIAEADQNPGVTFADIDLNQIDEARSRIPSLRHDRDFAPPT